MRRFLSARWWTAFAIIAPLCGMVAIVRASAGCKSCTTMACGATLTDTEIVLPFRPILTNGRLTVCRAEACESAVLAAGSANASTGGWDASGAPYLVCSGGTGFSCIGELDASNGRVSLTISIYDAGEGTPLSVTVATIDSTVVATHDGVPAYHSTEPNGPGCSPTCKEGRF